LRKGKPISVVVSFVTFFGTRVDPWRNSKLKYSLRNEEVILLNPRQQNYLNERMKWAEY